MERQRSLGALGGGHGYAGQATAKQAPASSTVVRDVDQEDERQNRSERSVDVVEVGDVGQVQGEARICSVEADGRDQAPGAVSRSRVGTGGATR